MRTIQLYFDTDESFVATNPETFAAAVQTACEKGGIMVTVRPYRIFLFLSKAGACRLAKDWMVGRAKGGFTAEGWANQYGSAESVAQHPPHVVTVYTRSGGYPGNAQLHPPPAERPGYPQKIELREDEVEIYVDEPDTVTIPSTLKCRVPETIVIKSTTDL